MRGTLLFDRDGSLFIGNPEATRERQLTEAFGGFRMSQARLSPLGSHVAYHLSGPNGLSTVELLNIGTGETRRISDESRSSYKPVFTRNGQQVVYVSQGADAQRVLNRVSVELGTGREWKRFAGRINNPDFSLDGRWLAVTLKDEGSSDILLVDLEKTGRAAMRRVGLDLEIIQDLRFSPDSKLLTFAARADAALHAYAIMVMEISTGRVRKLAELGDARFPLWSPDGDAIMCRLSGQDARNLLVKLKDRRIQPLPRSEFVWDWIG